MITLYLIALIIAPQLWIQPFVGLPVDYILYPLWLMTVLLKGRIQEFFRFRTIDWFFVAMLAWMLVTTVTNSVGPKTSAIIIDYFKWFVLYRLVITTVQTSTQLRRVMWIILGFVMLLVAEGIDHKLSADGIGWAGQALGWVDPSVLEAGGTGRTRWINIFDGPGVFCVIYTIGLPMALMLMGSPFNFGMRALGLLMVGPLLTAIYFTGSRGGFLATLAIIGLYLLLWLRVSLTRIGVVGAVLGVAILLAPSHLTSVRDESNSAQYRVEMWAEGVEMVTYNPIFGIGKGNFLDYTHKLIAHNSAVEIMGETGLPGLYLWFGLIYLALKGIYLFRVGSYDETDKAYVTALGVIIIGYLASSMFVTLEYETLYFLLALGGGVGNVLKEPVKFTERDFWVVGMMTVSWVVLVKAVAMIYF